MPVETMFHELLLTFLTAMVPVVELRGAIPVGVAAGLPPAAACAAAILGNMVPVPFILLLVRRAFAWLRDTKLLGPKIVWLERRAHLKGRLVRRYRLLGLVILVAIPLPGTGAWTGALVTACGAADPQDAVSKELEIDVSGGSEVSDYDTHSGNGDGVSCVVFSFADDQVAQEIEGDSAWSALPMDQTAQALAYGVSDETSSVGPGRTFWSGSP